MTKKLQKLGPLQEKWLTILESGLVPQGMGNLCTVGRTIDCDIKLRFCCLGVVEHFIMKHPYKKDGIKLYYKIAGEEDASDALSTASVEMLRFRSHSGGSADKGAPSLAGINDGGMSFKELAVFVRQDPSRYFKGPA